jgi:hypothetical protein
MRGDIAPIGVTNTGQHRPNIVFLGAGRPGHQRIPPVGADHDPRRFGNIRAAFRAAANAGHAAGGRGQSGDRELLPDFRPGLGGGVQQQLVENRPARRAHLGDPVDWRRFAGQLELAEIQSDCANDGAVGRQHALQQSPAFQARHPRRPDEMGRNGIARECRPIDEQHSTAAPRQQHRGRRAAAPRTDDDRVEHGRLPIASCSSQAAGRR